MSERRWQTVERNGSRAGRLHAQRQDEPLVRSIWTGRSRVGARERMCRRVGLWACVVGRRTG